MSTTKADLIVPEVIADMLTQDLPKTIMFAPLANVDNTLVSRAGDTVRLPKYAYIGDAEDVPESGSVPIARLSSTFEDVTVKKAGKGVTITDEAVQSGYGDPIAQISSQLNLSISNSVAFCVLVIT